MYWLIDNNMFSKCKLFWLTDSNVLSIDYILANKKYEELDIK